MQAKAKLRFLRISTRKVRLIADVIRGLKVQDAINQLGFLRRAAKTPILKLLKSAIANAENNFNLKSDNLYIKEIKVDEGGALKRWQPRAHGRATPIRKGLSHVLIVLDEIVPSKVKKAKVKEAKKEGKPVKVSSLSEIKKTPLEPTVKTERKGEESAAKELAKEAGKEIEDVRREGKHRHKQQEEKRTMKKSKGFIKKIFSRKAG